MTLRIDAASHFGASDILAQLLEKFLFTRWNFGLVGLHEGFVIGDLQELTEGKEFLPAFARLRSSMTISAIYCAASRVLD